MCGAQTGEAGRFITAARLEADKAVFNDINAADAVAACDGIDSQEKLYAICHRLLLAIIPVDQLRGQAFLEMQGEVFRGVGCLSWVLGEFPHICGRCGVGVLQNAGLVGAVGQVLIHTPWLGLCAGDGDACLCGVV